MKKRRPEWLVMDTIALWSMWGAFEADPALLARRLRSGKASPQEMVCAADLIEKKIKPRRPKKGKPTHMTNESIAETVLYIECFRPHWLRKAIISHVAEVFGVSTKHVYNVLAKHRNRPTELPYSSEIIGRILARE